MSASVSLYDTTLRDGTQAEGVNFSFQDKLRLVEKLDAFGVHYVEGGFPGSNDKDIAFFKAARKLRLKHARLAAFGATRRPRGAVASDPQVRLLLDSGTPVTTIVGKSWLLHVREVLRTTPEENLAMIADTVRHLKRHGREVIYDAEHFFDGYKADTGYALRALAAAAEAGADWIVLCDTNGGSLPREVGEITRAVISALPVKIGIHTHNDGGFGVANALAAVEAGATQVQGTINGYGERTGNCNLVTVIPNLQLKMGRKTVPVSSLRRLRPLSLFVDDLANLRPDPRAPFVGDSAFAHKGGQHVNAMAKSPVTYEHLAPELVGNRRRVLVGELSGRSAVLMKARDLGMRLDADSPEVREILAQVKRLEHQGFEFEAADASFYLLVRRALHRREPPFRLVEYHISMRRAEGQKAGTTEATLKLALKGGLTHTVAEGDGPVNALDGALRKALRPHFPGIARMRLTDYKVRILDSRSGTAARTRVLIESSDDKGDWGTVGVSDNIIEASWQALADSMEYFLLRRG
ncbi:MAG: citramalate synthase [Verrucomicrobiae bacterium]|nr:citramalate synthase [Verrucomicrobiae bacterium]